MKKEVLVKAAKELDKLLFEEPQIDFTQSPEKLVDSLMEASKELESDDELTKETIDVLGELWEGKDGKLTVEVCEIFQGLGILPLAKEDMKEGPEDAIIVDSLVEEVEDAERLKDLKDIAKSNDEFKEIRGKLSGYKDVDDLRGDMLDILDLAPEETEPEEAPEEKAAEPEYVQKMNKKKEEPKAKMEVIKGGKKEEIKKTVQLEKSNIIKGLVVGSKVQFTTAANSKKAPKKKLTGTITQIKNCNKLNQEVVQITTKLGVFHKTSKSITLKV